MEGRFEAVAGVEPLALGAAVCAQAFADDALVLAEDLAGFGVAQPLGQRGGVFDVR